MDARLLAAHLAHAPKGWAVPAFAGWAAELTVPGDTCVVRYRCRDCGATWTALRSPKHPEKLQRCVSCEGRQLSAESLEDA